MTRTRKAVLFISLFLFIHPVYGEKRNPKDRCASPQEVSKFLNQQAEAQSKKVRTSTSTTSQVGNIVILEADPELLFLSNTFDLQNFAIKFLPAGKGRYVYTMEVANFDGEASETIDLTDDDSRELIFRNFAFPFGKNSYDRCYVNSNGSITFGIPDAEPPATSVANHIPRIAALFTDLNPESLGTVFVRQTTDKVVISWHKVPEFFSQSTFDYGQNTFQIVLYDTGAFDIVFTNEITATQGFVGLIPGMDKVPVRFTDFSSNKEAGKRALSLVENFHDYISADLEQLMQSLYKGQPDRYEFVSLFSNFDLNPVPGAQAFAINVRNSVRGIGNPSDGKAIFKDNKKYGSKSKLQNITFFGNIHQYPDDPSGDLPDGEYSLLDIMAHEVGHRWLSYIKIPKNGEKSDALLGRDRSHWSFFLDSDGSFLEGSQILQRSPNSFETGNPFQRYSDLDLYLMGLKHASEVSDTYYVEGASGFSPDFPFDDDSFPEADVQFNGSAIPVTIDDVVASNGARKPGYDGSNKEYQHLFVLIVRKEQPATPEELGYLELVRAAWSDFFHSATDGRGSMNTSLEQ